MDKLYYDQREGEKPSMGVERWFIPLSVAILSLWWSALYMGISWLWP
jgi:hypothetical protein